MFIYIYIMFQLVENYMPLRFREIPLFLTDYSFLTPCVYVCVEGRGRITNCVQRVILHKYTKKCDVACSSKLLIFTISLLPQNMPFYLFLFA